MLAWLRTATPQLVALAKHAPLRFAALPPRAAWLRALRLELLEAHIRNERYGEQEQSASPFSTTA